jgi:hypothetical protein
MLQPKHTMYGFQWKDQRGVEGIGFVRALRSLLTAHLPVLRPILYNVISNHFDSQILKERGRDGKTNTDRKEAEENVLMIM